MVLHKILYLLYYNYYIIYYIKMLYYYQNSNVESTNLEFFQQNPNCTKMTDLKNMLQE